MDWVTCKISLAGDAQHIMYRGNSNPVSWPEITVIQHIHGEESVFDCEYLRSEPANMIDEKNRLSSIYGRDVVNLVYPGARPHIDADFPGEKSGDKAVEKRPARRPVPTRAEV
jgi:hypothetical protein